MYFTQPAVRYIAAIKLYNYRGLDDEKVPKDVTHVIVDDSVTIIKSHDFHGCVYLVSVIMGDNVKRIEGAAFWGCYFLRFIRLSKTLEYIEYDAFRGCEALEALFLPSTIKSIGLRAFYSCQSLRLLILPHDIDLDDDGVKIINGTAIYHIAKNAGVEYEWDEHGDPTDESNRLVNEWLYHHMDEAPFHKLCYDSSVTTRQIIDYLTENGNDAALAINPYHGMTPLHILSMNPHAPADAIAALFNSNMEAAFRKDAQWKTPLDYAKDYNVDGLLSMMSVLCTHRKPSIDLGVWSRTRSKCKGKQQEEIGN